MCKQLATLLLITLILIPSMGEVFAQDQPATTTAPARGETELLKTIVFITVEVATQGKLAKSVESLYGTGFLVGVADIRIPKERIFAYLVTNRHVAQAIEQNEKGECKAQQIGQTYVTLNLKDPVNGNRAETIPLSSSGQVHWYFPQDEAIDLAVTPVSIPEKYDFRLISLDQFLTTDALKQRQVVPGDRVLTGGFYSGYAGLHEIQPILREGALAMIPDGPMKTTMCKPGNVYLADLHIIPGNSGSPIFVIPTIGLGAGVVLGGVPNTFGLLGVISGYMIETEDFTLRASTTWKGALNENSGIAMVMPAQQLKDLLNTPELQHIRDEEAARQHSIP